MLALLGITFVVVVVVSIFKKFGLSPLFILNINIESNGHKHFWPFEGHKHFKPFEGHKYFWPWWEDHNHFGHSRAISIFGHLRVINIFGHLRAMNIFGHGRTMTIFQSPNMPFKTDIMRNKRLFGKISIISCI